MHCRRRDRRPAGKHPAALAVGCRPRGLVGRTRRGADAVPSVPLVAVALWWNANTIAHNFIHTPFFRSRALEHRLLDLPQRRAGDPADAVAASAPRPSRRRGRGGFDGHGIVRLRAGRHRRGLGERAPVRRRRPSRRVPARVRRSVSACAICRGISSTCAAGRPATTAASVQSLLLQRRLSRRASPPPGRSLDAAAARTPSLARSGARGRRCCAGSTPFARLVGALERVVLGHRGSSGSCSRRTSARLRGCC